MKRVWPWTALLASVLGASILLAEPEQAAPAKATRATAPPANLASLSKRLLALGKSCEAERVASAAAFTRHVLGRSGRAAWTIVLRSDDSQMRLAHARRIAEAAGGKLRHITPALISKYIGETEKNLDALFAEAERKDWVLFFDEADALFGKRSEVQDAHDRYANQEVAALGSALLEHRAQVVSLILLGTRSTDAPNPERVKRFVDRVVVVKPKLPDPVPPLPWSDVCWTAPAGERPAHALTTER